MDLPELLHTYGYVVVFVGALIEGETILLLGGYFAHQGYLSLGPVIAAAFVGAVCGDQLFFWIGRHHAKKLLARFPKLRDKVNVSLNRVAEHEIKVVLCMRFLWGLRIALPIAMGISNMRARRFLWLNLASAAVWSVAFAVIGFGAGRLLKQIEANMRPHEKWIAVLFVLLAVLALLWHAGRPKRPKMDQ